MKNQRVNYALVGGFVLGMLVVLVGVVALLTGHARQTDTYTTRFTNVTGVKEGTKVTFEGYVIGRVEDIEPQRQGGETSFRVTLSVRHGWRIPEGSQARIAASGLLSAVIVDIRAGAGQAALPPGSEIPGGRSANLFAVMSDVAGQMTDLDKSALKPLLQTLNSQVGHLGGLLDKQAPQILANMLAISNDLARKTPTITGNVERMTTTLSGKVVTEANARRMTRSLANVERLTQGLDATRHKLDATLTEVDRLVKGNKGTVNASLRDLRYTLQTMAHSIDSVTYNLEGASRNFNEFSRELRDDPAVLIGGRKTPDGPQSPDGPQNQGGPQ